jgi:hypothetical protein
VVVDHDPWDSPQNVTRYNVHNNNIHNHDDNNNNNKAVCDVRYRTMERELRDNQDLWNSMGIASYTITYRREDDDSTGNPAVGSSLGHTVQVVQGRPYAVDGVPVGKGFGVRSVGDGHPTVPDLFRQVQDAMDGGGHRCSSSTALLDDDIAYDATYGYPVRFRTATGDSVTTNLVDVDGRQGVTPQGDAATRRSLDGATVELFPTIVAFVLLTTVLL